jgi:hypothetical protein
LVGGTVGLALAHAFEAAYTAQTISKIVSPITASLKKVHEGISALARSSGGNSATGEQGAIQSILAQHRRETAASSAASAATTVLNPFTGKPRPYNGPDSSPPSPALPPPPNNGPGGGGAAQLGYAPGRPGQYTKDIAVDITELQNGNGKGP